MQFCTGFSFGLLLGTFLVLLLSAWLHGRADVKTLKAASRTRDMHAEYIAAYQQAPAAMTVERRRERFGEVAAPEINIGAVIQIESSGNPRAVSPAGCRGLCQIAEGTWVECCKWLGVSWTWSEDAFDPGCNRAVGNYYINHRIPAMLAHYGIDDSVTTRIGAYNWGIGNLRRSWTKHGHEWLAYAPKETQRYVLRYAELMAKETRS